MIGVETAECRSLQGEDLAPELRMPHGLAMELATHVLPSLSPQGDLIERPVEDRQDSDQVLVSPHEVDGLLC